MPAYVIAELKVTDPETYARYIELVPATITTYGGRYLARGGETETLAGERSPERLVILEFASMERARQWWTSDDYRGPRAIREASSESNILLVEGLLGLTDRERRIGRLADR